MLQLCCRSSQESQFGGVVVGLISACASTAAVRSVQKTAARWHPQQMQLQWFVPTGQAQLQNNGPCSYVVGQVFVPCVNQLFVNVVVTVCV